MLVNIYLFLGLVIWKFFLNRVCKLYKNDFRLERSEKRLLFECYCIVLLNENEGGLF